MNVYTNTIVIKGEDVNFSADINDTIKLIGIADGHGGDGAALVCKRNVANIIKKYIDAGTDLETCCMNTFQYLHRECKQLDCCSGCTLTILLIDKNTGKYICANVGDSMAIHIKSHSHSYPYWN